MGPASERTLPVPVLKLPPSSPFPFLSPPHPLLTAVARHSWDNTHRPLTAGVNLCYSTACGKQNILSTHLMLTSHSENNVNIFTFQRVILNYFPYQKKSKDAAINSFQKIMENTHLSRRLKADGTTCLVITAPYFLKN